VSLCRFARFPNGSRTTSHYSASERQSARPGSIPSNICCSNCNTNHRLQPSWIRLRVFCSHLLKDAVATRDSKSSSSSSSSNPPTAREVPSWCVRSRHRNADSPGLLSTPFRSPGPLVVVGTSPEMMTDSLPVLRPSLWPRGPTGQWGSRRHQPPDRGEEIGAALVVRACVRDDSCDNCYGWGPFSRCRHSKHM